MAVGATSFDPAAGVSGCIYEVLLCFVNFACQPQLRQTKNKAGVNHIKPHIVSRGSSVYTEDVGGSIPSPPTIFIRGFCCNLRSVPIYVAHKTFSERLILRTQL